MHVWLAFGLPGSPPGGLVPPTAPSDRTPSSERMLPFVPSESGSSRTPAVPPQKMSVGLPAKPAAADLPGRHMPASPHGTGVRNPHDGRSRERAAKKKY